jgi:hypothetical protein
MKVVVKIINHTQHTLTRDSGNRLYKIIHSFLLKNPDVNELIFDFRDVNDVSTSFIQSTYVKLSDEIPSLRMINYNDAIRFKIATLLKITNINPAIFKKAKHYPPSPVFL